MAEGRKTEKAGKASARAEAGKIKAAEAKTVKTKTAEAGKTKAAEAKAPSAAREPRTGIKPKASKTLSRPAKKAPSFILYEPQATEVFVAGCFNDWSPVATPLERDEAGTWSCTIDLEPGRHEYRFVVDGEWRDDPLNVVRCSNEFGTENCVVILEE